MIKNVADSCYFKLILSCNRIIKYMYLFMFINWILLVHYLNTTFFSPKRVLDFQFIRNSSGMKRLDHPLNTSVFFPNLVLNFHFFSSGIIPLIHLFSFQIASLIFNIFFRDETLGSLLEHNYIFYISSLISSQNLFIMDKSLEICLFQHI